MFGAGTRKGFSVARLCIVYTLMTFLAVPSLYPVDEMFEERDTFDEDDQQDDEEQDEEEENEVDVDVDDPEPDEDDGEEDTDGDSGSDSGGIDFDSLTTRPTEFSGSVSASFGAALSLLEWPGTGDYDESDPFDYAAGYTLGTTFEVDSRPKPYLRFNARIGTSIDTDIMDFTTPKISSLYLDYTLADNITFRAGKFGMTWGSARVLSNVANLVSDVSDGVALRAVAPVGTGTFNAVGYSTEDFLDEYNGDDPRAFAYAVNVEQTWSLVSVAAAAHTRPSAFESGGNDTLDMTGSVATSAGPFDLTFEGVHRLNPTSPWESENIDLEVLSQVAWEGGDPRWIIGAEHLYDNTVGGFRGHRAGIALRMPRFSALGVNWRPQVRARHAFYDHSGDVVTGLSGGVAPDMTMSVGLPLRYGPPGSHYRDDDFGDDLQGVDGVAALGLGLSLSFSF